MANKRVEVMFLVSELLRQCLLQPIINRVNSTYSIAIARTTFWKNFLENSFSQIIMLRADNNFDDQFFPKKLTFDMSITLPWTSKNNF